MNGSGKVMKSTCMILLSVFFLLGCGSGSEYYPEMLIGEWTGHGLFSPLSYEYSNLDMKFTKDSLYYRGVRTLDSTIVDYGFGPYSINQTQYTWTLTPSDSNYRPIAGPGWTTTDGYEYKDGVFTNKWGLWLKKK
jgi:hypothetical protein